MASDIPLLPEGFLFKPLDSESIDEEPSSVKDDDDSEIEWIEDTKFRGVNPPPIPPLKRKRKKRRMAEMRLRERVLGSICLERQHLPCKFSSEEDELQAMAAFGLPTSFAPGSQEYTEKYYILGDTRCVKRHVGDVLPEQTHSIVLLLQHDHLVTPHTFAPTASSSASTQPQSTQQTTQSSMDTLIYNS